MYYNAEIWGPIIYMRSHVENEHLNNLNLSNSYESGSIACDTEFNIKLNIIGAVSQHLILST